ncbi:MAG: DUF6597 domain-containing transcriptional factor [Pyrinomonadaceae bacterium]
MLYQTFAPPPLLAPYVRFFWVLEADVVPGSEFVHRALADGCVEMVFHYRARFDEVTEDGLREFSPLSSIQGQSAKFHRFSGRSSFGIFGAYLFPFAIPRLFSLPAYDFTNAAHDLESSLGIEGKLLEEQMITAENNERRVEIISRYFTERLARANRSFSEVHNSVRSIIAAKGDVNIVGLAREHRLSTRQFERRFKEMAGLSPKLYSRIIRFQAATQHRLEGNRDLTDIAYACGYYDQSHFINDFREFSGYTPKEYFWNEAEGTQYMDGERMSHFSN